MNNGKLKEWYSQNQEKAKRGLVILGSLAALTCLEGIVSNTYADEAHRPKPGGPYSGASVQVPDPELDTECYRYLNGAKEFRLEAAHDPVYKELKSKIYRWNLALKEYRLVLKTCKNKSRAKKEGVEPWELERFKLKAYVGMAEVYELMPRDSVNTLDRILDTYQKAIDVGEDLLKQGKYDGKELAKLYANITKGPPWKPVVKAMERAVELDSENEDYKRYLDIAKNNYKRFPDSN